MKNKIKEITYAQDLPSIEISKTRHIHDFEVEREYIRVKAHTIQQCRNELNYIKRQEKK